jgi:FixJ family two-component response regulator
MLVYLRIRAHLRFIMPATRAYVAVVDDDPGLRESLVGLLASAGYAARAFASAEAFLESACAPACVILDGRLPGISGPELLEQLRAKGDRVPIVMISARADDEIVIARALQSGAAACLRKPFACDELLAAVRRAMRRHETKVQ